MDIDKDFRQLLLEAGSSTTIRAIENLTSIPNLIIDPLHEQGTIGKISEIQKAIHAATNQSTATQLTPKLFCIVPVPESGNPKKTETTASALILTEQNLEIPETLDSKEGYATYILIIYYCYNSAIEHGKVKIREP
ncbi:MAG: hypothetical protein EP312_00280 [Gammaproteobacteria bacterium]|nr:MAG: hypothetical protein EP312_00280 [Gammaproteobacteria bacterium]